MTLKRSKRLRSMSPTRDGERHQRDDVRDAVRRRDRYCVMDGAMGPCRGLLEVHEVLPRSAGVWTHLDVDACVLVCARHHRIVTVNPHIGYVCGMKIPRWQPTDPGYAEAAARRADVRRGVFRRPDALSPEEFSATIAAIARLRSEEY